MVVERANVIEFASIDAEPQTATTTSWYDPT